jgi:hypothetical protein
MEYASQATETETWSKQRPIRSRGPGREADSAGSEASPLSDEERERMMLEHMPAVRWMARRIHERLPQHVDMEDLVSAGTVGLLDAFRKFDPAKKVQFRSYAQFRIRGAILDSLRTLDWSPRDLRRKGPGRRRGDSPADGPVRASADGAGGRTGDGTGARGVPAAAGRAEGA